MQIERRLIAARCCFGLRPSPNKTFTIEQLPEPSRLVLETSHMLALLCVILWRLGRVARPRGHGGGLASHERYLSGLLLAIGLAFWTTVSDIECKTARFCLLTALVVIGGASACWAWPWATHCHPSPAGKIRTQPRPNPSTKCAVVWR